MKKAKDADTRTPLERLADFTRKLISVPKEEIEQQERRWKDERQDKHKTA